MFACSCGLGVPTGGDMEDMLQLGKRIAMDHEKEDQGNSLESSIGQPEP